MSNPDPDVDPIIVVGAPRSGTTLLAEQILGTLPTVVYWPEPVFIWSYKNAYSVYDNRNAADADEATRRYIRKRFREYLERGTGSVIVEKTPSNCLRLPFILQVFPRARIVHVIRDGRDAALSSLTDWKGEGGRALDYPQLRRGGRVRRLSNGLGTFLRLDERVRDVRSLMELPAYSGRFFAYVCRILFNWSMLSWGPRFPGLRAIRLQHSLLETCAIQWAYCIHSVMNAKHLIPTGNYVEVRYEELVRDPEDQVTHLFRTLDVEFTSEELHSVTRRISDVSVQRWSHGLSGEQLRAVEEHIGFTLRCLDYELASA